MAPNVSDSKFSDQHSPDRNATGFGVLTRAPFSPLTPGFTLCRGDTASCGRDHAFAFRDDTEPPIAKPAAFIGNRLQLVATFRIIRRFVAPDGLGVETNKVSCPRAAGYHNPVSPETLPLVARLALSFLSRQIFRDYVVQHRARQQAFQFGILIRDRAWLCLIRHFRAAVS